MSTAAYFTEEMCRAAVGAYFADNSVVSCQIRSFNHFISHMIPSIVCERDTVVVRSKKKNAVHVIRFGKVTILKPTILTPSKYMKRILPAEARKKGLTYSSSIFVDVMHEIYDATETSSTAEYGKLLERRPYYEMPICEWPVMLGSDLCYTTEMCDPIAADECLYDPGGYFIINGNEKTMLCQVNMRTNFPYVSANKQKNNKYAFSCEVRSWNEDKIRSTSTLYMNLTRTKGGAMPEVFVNVPFIDYEIPLASMFRLLGVVSVDEMRLYITGEPRTPQEFHLDHLTRAVLKDALPGSTLDELQEFIGAQATTQKSAEMRRRYVMHLVHNEVLPHVGLARTEEVRRKKVYYLGYAIRKLLMVSLQMLRPDDRDDMSMKRLMDPGMLCGLQFRYHYRSFIKQLKNDVLNAVEGGNYITLSNFISPKRITNAIRNAYSTGDWSTAKGTTTTMQGVVQMLTRMTPLSALSHMRRTNTPLNREGKAAAPRQLHCSSYAITCPCETPEGKACGLINNLATGAHIRPPEPTQPLLDLVQHLGLVKPVLECTAADFSQDTVVLVNGNLIGTTREPERLRAQLVLYRRYEDLPRTTSIYYSAPHRQFQISADAGSISRPCFQLSECHKLSGLYVQYGSNPREFWMQLLSEGVVEFIDKDEENMLVIADTIGDLQDSMGTKYTHMSLHPLTVLGITAALIPFSEHNQAPRNMYQSAMGKQADGMPASNYNNRFDSKMHVLDSGQMPLVTTFISDTLQLDGLPSGENCLVAFGCLEGYNQEDSCIFNKTALDMGLFASTSLITIRDQEKQNGSDRDHFGKPDETTTQRLQLANYDKVHPQTGLVTPGTYIVQDDVIIAKTMSTGALQKKDKTDQVIRDRSQVWKNSEPAVVDAVLTTATSTHDDAKYARLRLRSHRKPEIGDKFSSRHGQKGVIGLIVPEEDMPRTADGRTPDIIINPHCLKGDTRILLALNDTVPISQLVAQKSTPEVVTVYPSNLHTALTEITEPFGFQSTESLYHITLLTGHSVECTGDHPFMLYNRVDKSLEPCQAADLLVNSLAHLCVVMHTRTAPESTEFINPISCLIARLQGYLHRLPTAHQPEKVREAFAAELRLCFVALHTPVYQVPHSIKTAPLAVKLEYLAGVFSSMEVACSENYLQWSFTGSREFHAQGYHFLQELKALFEALQIHCNVWSTKHVTGHGFFLSIPLFRPGWADLLYSAYNREQTYRLSHIAMFWRMKDQLPDLTWSFFETHYALPHTGLVCCPVWSVVRTAPAMVYDFTTVASSHTFIANNIVVHNCFPSRMTIAHLFETLLGTACALEGKRGDGTPFRCVGVEQIAEVLHSHGYQRYGDEVMYSGSTGEMLPQRMFMGMIYYQRLKHQVIDKMHARSTGPRQMLTRQPNEGRAKDGGLRFGEMERDCCVSYGAAHVLRDRLFLQSDYFETPVCTRCGLLAERRAPRKQRYYTHVLNEEKEEYYCRNCRSSEDIPMVAMPYALKLLVQELTGCHAAVRLHLEKIEE